MNDPHAFINLKKRAYRFCEQYVTERLQRFAHQIGQLRLSLESETKSSAGDKHETGRAMLQLELEKLGRQLLEAEKTAAILKKITLEHRSGPAALGSLVITENAMYFIAVSAGKFSYANTTIFCISPMTPIGKLLLGKEEGGHINFNGIASVITKIF